MNLEDIPNEVQKYIIFYEDLDFIKVIGSGAYGEVSEGIYVPSQQKVAIKQLYETELNNRNRELYKREITALATLKNPFLLPFVGFTISSPFCIVTKFIPNNSLYNNLHDPDAKLQLTPTEYNIIAYGIAVGMEYLHQNKVIHRDLKPQNVLIDDKKFPIICDFGSSKHVDLQQTMTGQAGTPHYMAPEFLQNEKYNGKVDVYSYGILLWEMITKQNPFDGLAWAQILCVVVVNKQRPPIPENLDPQLKALITKCWDPDPKKRPSFAEIVRQFTNGEVAYPGTSRTEFVHILNAHPQTKLYYQNYRKQVASQAYKINKNGILLAQTTEQNHSAQFTIRPSIPLQQLKQTASSYMFSLTLQSTVQQQLLAISFFDTNCDSPALIGLDLWVSLLNLSLKPNPAVLNPLTKLINKLAQRPEVLSDIIKVKDLYKYVSPNTLDLFLYIVTFFPGLINENIINRLFFLYDSQQSDHASALLSKIVSILTTQKHLVQKILTEFRNRAEKSASMIGGNHIILTLLKTKSFPLEIIPMFAASKIPANSIAGYQALFTLNGVPRGFKLDFVCNHLKSSNISLRTAALEFLRRYETKEEAMTQVITNLIESYIEYGDERALLLLCKAAANPKNGKVLTWNGVIEKWMNSIPMKAPSFLKIFILLVVNHKDFGSKFILHKLTPSFLEHVIHHGDQEVLAAVLWVMNAMSMTKEYAKALQDVSLFVTLCKKMCINHEAIIFEQCRLLLQKCMGFIDCNPGFSDLTVHLLNIIKHKEEGVDIGQCIMLLNCLSQKKSTYSTFINENAIAVINPYASNSKYKPQIQSILKNLRQNGLNIP